MREDSYPSPAREHLVNLFEAVYGRLDEPDAPDLGRDPVAMMLGLVLDGSRIDPILLSAALQGSGISEAELARRIAARGWAITTSDVISWRRHVMVIPALIRAAEQVLGLPEGTLRAED